MPKMNKISMLTDEQFIDIVSSSYSIRDILSKCGYSNHSEYSYNLVRQRMQELNLSFTAQYHTKNIYNELEIFRSNSLANQATLRRHYLAGKYTPYKCAICGQEPIWQGKELTLTLDHINGDNHDDRLENLRWVCPNCDRQLETFTGRNIKSAHKMKQIKCIQCGKIVYSYNNKCPDCLAQENSIKRRKVEWPDRETLKKEIRETSFVALGKKYNVSNKAITKWCQKYDLPYRRSDIKLISDDDWEKI